MEQNSRVSQKSTLIIVTSALAVALGCEYRPPARGQIRSETAAVASPKVETFRFVTDVQEIPSDASKALAQHFGAPMLQLAEPAAEYNHGCLLDSNLPRRRLALAAVSPSIVVIHYEEGGFAPSAQIAVIQRGPGGVSSVAHQLHADRIYTSPREFESALQKLLPVKTWSSSNPRLGV